MRFCTGVCLVDFVIHLNFQNNLCFLSLLSFCFPNYLSSSTRLSWSCRKYGCAQVMLMLCSCSWNSLERVLIRPDTACVLVTATMCPRLLFIIPGKKATRVYTMKLQLLHDTCVLVTATVCPRLLFNIPGKKATRVYKMKLQLLHDTCVLVTATMCPRLLFNIPGKKATRVYTMKLLLLHDTCVLVTATTCPRLLFNIPARRQQGSTQ